MPVRNAQGVVVNRPTSALDLHYLMSFYGDDSKFEPQRMLGAVVVSLLAEPGLTRARILGVSKDDNNDQMDGSDLANAVEQVKFTQQALNLEELSRIWSIFYQVPYVLSIAYTATVVILESEETVQAALPVMQRGQKGQAIDLQTGPFPQLDSWHIGEGNDDTARLRLPSYPGARLGTVLTLRGQNLNGDSLVVRIINQHLQLSVPDLPVTLIPNRPGELKVSIPNPTADASQWVAGIYSVAVVITTAGVTRSTNTLAMPFAPQISGITVGARDGNGNVLVTVTPAPAVLASQAAILALPAGDVAANARTLDTDPLSFTVVAPAAGQEVVQLRVDGVNSLQFSGQGTPPRPALALQTIQFPP